MILRAWIPQHGTVVNGIWSVAWGSWLLGCRGSCKWRRGREFESRPGAGHMDEASDIQLSCTNMRWHAVLRQELAEQVKRDPEGMQR